MKKSIKRKVHCGSGGLYLDYWPWMGMDKPLVGIIVNTLLDTVDGDMFERMGWKRILMRNGISGWI